MSCLHGTFQIATDEIGAFWWEDTEHHGFPPEPGEDWQGPYHSLGECITDAESVFGAAKDIRMI